MNVRQLARIVSLAVVVAVALFALAGPPERASASTFSAVAAGSQHTCALTTGGGVQCWGRNNYGQLGDGTTTDRVKPVNVSGLTSGVTKIAIGTWHSCAVTSGGNVKCWGRNGNGELGRGTLTSTTPNTTPENVCASGSGGTCVAQGGISAATAGEQHTCVLTTGGAVLCWGNNQFGQLGDGTTVYKTNPVTVSGLGSGVIAVDAGGYGQRSSTLL